MQYIDRKLLNTILRILLIIGLTLSFSTTVPGGLYIKGQLQTKAEIERVHSKFVPPVRTDLKITPQIVVIKFLEQWMPKAIAVTALHGMLSILFLPVIYILLLRLRLYVLKFTSHFVTISTLSRVHK